MKTFVAALLLIGSICFGSAATTIDATNQYAYGANIGWMDWRGDTNNGAVIGEYVCSGYIYSANVGWINLGSGGPTNGIRYLNLAANDFGLNQDGLGNLRGFAYGANIGWIFFEKFGAARVDLMTGNMSGAAWSANCGWIDLSNAVMRVQTDVIEQSPDKDSNGLPDAWERLNFGHIGVDPNADPDDDGMSNRQEYLSDTNPLDANSDLEITTFTAVPGGTTATITWESVLTRNYYVQKRLDLNPGFLWSDSGLGLIRPDGSITTRTILDSAAPRRFYRVQAIRPLSP